MAATSANFRVPRKPTQTHCVADQPFDTDVTATTTDLPTTPRTPRRLAHSLAPLHTPTILCDLDAFPSDHGWFRIRWVQQDGLRAKDPKWPHAVHGVLHPAVASPQIYFAPTYVTGTRITLVITATQGHGWDDVCGGSRGIRESDIHNTILLREARSSHPLSLPPDQPTKHFSPSDYQKYATAMWPLPKVVLCYSTSKKPSNISQQKNSKMPPRLSSGHRR
ncbi:hypothetical protein EDB84DRAFT_1435032 [Lactarius hengduanensis]|nr:hypothetical protein EDB84DRAFT_1435032 [Lactarius hengduanensis]